MTPASPDQRPALLVAFGLPGAGKTYAGQVIAETLDCHFHDGDTDLPDDMRAAINASQPVSDAMRDAFFTRILNSLERLRTEHPRIVLAQTFLKERHRQWVIGKFPEAQFILVKADQAVRRYRLEHRTSMPLALDYVRRMDSLFEPPQIPTIELENNQNGPDHIREWASNLIEQQPGT